MSRGTYWTRYWLGKENESIYLTKREAECVDLLVKGLSHRQIANELKLAYRTVEYYIKRVRRKTECRTSKELFEMILQTDFLKKYRNK